MKHILVLTLILGISLLSYGANQTIKLGETFYTSNHVRAYHATTATGKRIIYVTNKEHKGNEVVFSSSPIPFRGKAVQTSRRVPPVTSIRRSESVVIAPEKLKEPSIKNGIPVCIWKGQVITPIRVGTRLVCPSESSPLATSPE